MFRIWYWIWCTYKFFLSDGGWFCKNVIILDAGVSSSGHVDNRKKDILIPGKGTTPGLDDTTLGVEKEYTKF